MRLFRDEACGCSGTTRPAGQREAEAAILPDEDGERWMSED